MSTQEATDYLIGKGWQFRGTCSKCSGGGLKYTKREYEVKLIGSIFKLYYRGHNTNTQPLGNLADIVKDI